MLLVLFSFLFESAFFPSAYRRRFSLFSVSFLSSSLANYYEPFEEKEQISFSGTKVYFSPARNNNYDFIYFYLFSLEKDLDE